MADDEDVALADKVLDDEAEYVSVDDALTLGDDVAVVELLIDAVGELVMQTASAVGPQSAITPQLQTVHAVQDIDPLMSAYVPALQVVHTPPVVAATL